MRALNKSLALSSDLKELAQELIDECGTGWDFVGEEEMAKAVNSVTQWPELLAWAIEARQWIENVMTPGEHESDLAPLRLSEGFELLGRVDK